MSLLRLGRKTDSGFRGLKLGFRSGFGLGMVGLGIGLGRGVGVL